MLEERIKIENKSVKSITRNGIKYDSPKIHNICLDTL